VGKMLGSNGKRDSDGEEKNKEKEVVANIMQEIRKPSKGKEDIQDSGYVKHFKKKGKQEQGGLLETMKGLLRKPAQNKEKDEEEILRPDMSQDIGGKTIQDRKKEEQQKKKEEEQKKKKEEIAKKEEEDNNVPTRTTRRGQAAKKEEKKEEEDEENKVQVH